MLAPDVILVYGIMNHMDARVLLAEIKSQGGEEWTLSHVYFVHAEGFVTISPSRRICDAETVVQMVRDGDTRPPISEAELRGRSKSDWVRKLVVVSQISWFGIQTLCRAVQHLTLTALEILTVAFIACSVFTCACCWSEPQHVDYPVVVDDQSFDVIDQRVNGGNNAADSVDSRRNLVKRIQSKSSLRPFRTSAEGRGICVLIALILSGFGAIHCLAWNPSFLTHTEELIWRVCAPSTTFLPAEQLLFLASEVYIWGRKGSLQKVVKTGFMLLLGCYVIARTIQIVLAFIALRALSTDAYETVNWVVNAAGSKGANVISYVRTEYLMGHLASFRATA
ncbi:hypothetical protein MMC27_003118 [Xylographa pallens]|nr:hypothetical protein [Xylographa pallens]